MALARRSRVLDPTANLSRSVVLVHPTASGPGRRLRDTGFLIPPLGIMYLTAQLRRRDIPVVAVNEEVDGEVLPRLLRAPAATAPLLLGIYCNDSSVERVLELLRATSAERAARTVVGGPSALEPDRFLEAGADAVCLGEGDETIHDLVAWASGAKPLPAIPVAPLMVHVLQIFTPQQNGFFLKPRKTLDMV